MLSYLEIYQMLEIWVLDPGIFFFLTDISFKTFIRLAAWGLSCIMQDLSLWHTDSLVGVHGLSCSMARGILVP